MKITWVTFGLGWLAIIGVPPFSGFWSKDKIIEAAFEGAGWQPWVFGIAALLGAGITAFYMTRLFFMTFHGERRWTDDVHPHESPLVMTVPADGARRRLGRRSAWLLGPTGADPGLAGAGGGRAAEESTRAAGGRASLTLTLVARRRRRRPAPGDVPAPAGPGRRAGRRRC